MQMNMPPPSACGSGAVSGRRPDACLRPEVRGKSIYRGGAPLALRGVTYGTFGGGPGGDPFPGRETVARDFGAMAGNGINALRLYTPPARWLLDLAEANGLSVLIGLPWGEHVAFLARTGSRHPIEAEVRRAVRTCAGHPAVLAYAIGNEIPASVVRWHGRVAVERFLHRLFRAVKQEDPDGLVTYVNYPSTEYLRMPFLDFCAFNVYLEDPRSFETYLARLQNIAGDRPLVMAEVGLDSRRHGVAAQARLVGEQVRLAGAAGCAGAFVFSWTDEWHRGGEEILDWDFGLTTRERIPKPALTAVREVFRGRPSPADPPPPRISVVVCTYDGSRTLGETLRHLAGLRYPDFEIIVVDDGSRDGCADIARQSGARVISTPNRGLSAARNTGWQSATGAIVAYLDDDAYPHPDWLHHLAAAFDGSTHAGIGGPNIGPRGDGWVAECVANAPGGPTQVLLTDTQAEHIPGCNMAFRRGVLEALGGFDPQFRVAGDDVDVCWRIRQRGWTIGFSAAAFVWHHRRNSVRGYWRQQVGYGRAEALLERKWPERYNAIGHVRWGGQLYGHGVPSSRPARCRVFHGVWGAAPFQSLEETPPGLVAVFTTIPEWYLVLLALGAVSGLGFFWPKLFLSLPLLALAGGGTAWRALSASAGANFQGVHGGRPRRIGRHLLTGLLYFIQPLARLTGRVAGGLTPFRKRTRWGLALPFPSGATVWSEAWRPPGTALEAIAAELRRDGAPVVLGGGYDRWDLEVRGGTLAAARLLAMTEEHGAGRQLFRFRYAPRFSAIGPTGVVLFAALSFGAATDQQWIASHILSGLALLLLGRMLLEGAAAMAALRRALPRALGVPATCPPSKAAARPLRVPSPAIPLEP